MTFSRQRQGNTYYAVYDFSDLQVEIDNISVMMINNNQGENSCLAAIALDEMNGVCTGMRFDVTGRMSIKDFISNNISQEDFRRMIRGLITALEDMEDYMIDTSQLVLDIENVYINRTDFSVTFLCLAVEGYDNNTELYDFFDTIIPACGKRTVPSRDGEINFLNKALYIMGRREGFSLENLKREMESNDYSHTVVNRSTFREVKDENRNNPMRDDGTSVLTIQGGEGEAAGGSFRQNAAMPLEEDKQYKSKKKALDRFGSLFKKNKVMEDNPPEESSAGDFKSGMERFAKGKNRQIAGEPAAGKNIDQNLNQNIDTRHKQQTFGGSSVLMSGMSDPSSVPAGNDRPSPARQQAAGSSYFGGGSQLLGSGNVYGKSESGAPAGGPQTTFVGGAQNNNRSFVPTSYTNARIINLKNNDTIYFKQATIVIGRQTDGLAYDVKDNNEVSHRHARLTRTGKGVTIVDLVSTNGTKVNGLFIQPDVEIELKDGDVFELGSEKFQFRMG